MVDQSGGDPKTSIQGESCMALRYYPSPRYLKCDSRLLWSRVLGRPNIIKE